MTDITFLDRPTPARLLRPAAVRPDQARSTSRPAVDALLADAERGRRARERARPPATGRTSSSRWTDANERLGRAWGAVGHLNAVADTPELRAAYNENLPRVTEFWTRASARTALYAKYKAHRRERRLRRAVRRSARRSSTTRCATSASAAPSCRRRPKPRFAADPGRAGRSCRKVLRERARRDQRLRLRRRRTKRTRRHARGRASQRRARRRETRRQGRLQVHAAHARPTCR